MELDEPPVLRYGSFYSGIEAPLQALQSLLAWSGVTLRHEFAVESDKHCVAAMRANYHCERLLEQDVATLDMSTLPRVDVFVAGFPCQPYSIIGKQLGAQDERADGWIHCVAYCRVARPALVLLENVAAFQRDQDGATLQRLKTALHQECGYAMIDHAVLDALDYGSCQHRERLFILAALDAETAARWKWPTPRPTCHVPFCALLEPEAAAQESLYITQTRLDYMDRRRVKMTSSCRVLDARNADLVPCLCAAHRFNCYNHMIRELDGRVRMISMREALRLMGFSDDFRIVCSRIQTMKQAGNSMSVQVMQALLHSALVALRFVNYEQT